MCFFFSRCFLISLLSNVIGWSVICGCRISWSYFFVVKDFYDRTKFEQHVGLVAKISIQLSLLTTLIRTSSVYLQKILPKK